MFLVFAFFLFLKIPCESLNVDRWSIITAFWDNYLNGNYVYFAKSNAGNLPGPMPFYFILAFPFYLAGELGYFSILGCITFYLLLKYDSIPSPIKSIYLILILSSIFYVWEVVSRSNIFLNSSLILLSIVYLFKSIENKHPNRILWNGIIIGLLLSTRNVFVIAYIITFLFCLKQQYLSVREIIFIGIVAAITFGVTFLPFVFNHVDDFRKMNPFIIQSSFLMPIQLSLTCILLSFGTFFMIKEKNDVFFFSGLVLFITIVFHFVYKVIMSSFSQALFNHWADISYFILCIPFLVFYLIKNEPIVNRKANT
jgi:hypothetical protein